MPFETSMRRVSHTPQAWWARPLPAWAQAAAAAAIFASGLAIGAVSGRDRPANVTASVAPAAAPSAAPVGAIVPVAANTLTGGVSTVAAAADGVSRRDLEDLERRLLAELRDVRAAAAAPARGGESAMLRQVQSLIEESEDRQRRELALRTAQVVRDFDVQRRMDLVQVQRTMGQMEAVTGAQVRDQRQIANWLRVSQQR